MLRPVNVARPFAAECVFVPDNVPPLGLAPIATLIDPLKPVTTFPASSSAATCTVDIVAPAWVVCGCWVNPRSEERRVGEEGGAGSAVALYEEKDGLVGVGGVVNRVQALSVFRMESVASVA